MHVAEWLAVADGIAAIAWVNWYFFVAERRSAAAEAKVGATGLQQTVIRVEGGYVPSRVRTPPRRKTRAASVRSPGGFELLRGSGDPGVRDPSLPPVAPADQRRAPGAARRNVRVHLRH